VTVGHQTQNTANINRVHCILIQDFTK